jgi:signal transduction histidine kinase
VWQIVTVAVLGLRLNAAFVPLIARAGVILAAACTTVLLMNFGKQTVDQGTTLIPALLLLCVAALASLPLPSAVPPLVPALAETLAAALIVGAIGPDGALFMLYLVIPLFFAATRAGLTTALGCAATGVVTLVAMVTLTHQDQASLWRDSSLFTAAACIFIGVPVVGSWMRRVAEETAPDSEIAYADAHRLLTELHVVARQLSLGLDPRTLAAALADDIRTVVPHAAAAVLGRSPGGRFMALTGQEPPDEAGPAIEDAWVSGTAMGRDHDGKRFTAVPVLMGDRVVALVVIMTTNAIDGAALRRCQSLIDQSGPRLASAVLFDDVRRLATTDERMRLAREIHDGIAQDLASVGYLLDDIRRDSDPAVAGRVAGVREQLQAMVGDLRMSIFDLRSGIDDSISLGTALSDYAQRVGSQAGLVVTISMDESPKRLPVSVEAELLRIVQEAITNVRRHARASNLWISVTVEPPKAHITISDDGRGMRPGRADSFGITGMRERARRIGATLDVRSGSDGGTVVEVALGTDPLTAREVRPLPRTVISRGALTDPHGMPALSHLNGESGNHSSSDVAASDGHQPHPVAHATSPGDAGQTRR